MDELEVDELYARLHGLRLTASVHPDVGFAVALRISKFLRGLDRDQLVQLVHAALNASSAAYILARPELAQRQADNIARTIRAAEDAGVA